VIRKSILLKYARSLAEVAQEAGQTARVKRDFEALAAVVDGVPEFMQVMQNPVVALSVKAGLADSLGRKLDLHPYLAEFLRVLIRHHRIMHLPAIHALFEEELNRLAGVVRTRVVTARPLADEALERLRRELARILNHGITLDTVVDPELIGGIKLEVAGKVYDGSIRLQLDRLKSIIVSA